MWTRVSYWAAVIALVICFVCPVLEMFDYWDRTLQTGNDIEYTLVLLALCVGMVCALARLIVTFTPRLSSISISPNSPGIQSSLLFSIHPLRLDSALGSPPLNIRV
jgi:hypothetical protein